MPKTSTPAQYVLILIDMAESQGCDRASLLAGTSLAKTGISNIGARVSDRDFAILVGNALRLTGDPALGLNLGLRLNLSAHAVLGQAFMTCRDLGQVIDLFLKYYHLLAPALHLEYEMLDGYCVLTTVSSLAETPLDFSYELICGAMLNTLRGLLNRSDFQLRLEVPYPEPAHSAHYFEVFGPDIRFDCVTGRIGFHQDLRKLEGQYPQMPQTAKLLNLSPRTYRRRLEEENRSYQQLLDQVRAEHATRYLQNTRLPLSSIAYLIGFNDASNFRRAYQKWTGRSPANVRHGR